MKKEDWIRKLTSRKFWVCLAGLITGLVAFIQNPTTDSKTIGSLVLALGSMVAYIVAEGLVDAARESGDLYVVPDDYEPEEHPPEDAA